MRKQMQFGLLLAAGIAAGAIAGPSFATEVKLSGTHSQAAVGAACQAVGGRSWTTAPMGGGRYGCINDKKGTSVTCTPGGECTGEVPDQQAAGGGMKNLVGVLSGLAVEPGKKSPPPAPGILEGAAGFNANAPASTGKPKVQGIR